MAEPTIGALNHEADVEKRDLRTLLEDNTLAEEVARADCPPWYEAHAIRIEAIDDYRAALKERLGGE